MSENGGYVVVDGDGRRRLRCIDCGHVDGTNDESSNSCIDLPFPDGTSRIRFGQERQFVDDPSLYPPANCEGCGVATDGFHHGGCEEEECPRCHLPLVPSNCGCWFTYFYGDPDFVPEDEPEATS